MQGICNTNVNAAIESYLIVKFFTFFNFIIWEIIGLINLTDYQDIFIY